MSYIVVFLLQIAAVFLRMNQYSEFSGGDLCDFIYGPEWNIHSWDMHGVELWMLEEVLFCVVIIRNIERYRDEHTYMQIIRKASWKVYYKSIYCQIALKVIFYHLSMSAGLLAGECFAWLCEPSIYINVKGICCAVLALGINNMLYVACIEILICQYNLIKLSLLVCPMVPLASCYLVGRLKNVAVYWPGNWGMLRRSSVMDQNGYSFGVCLLLEIIMTAILYCIFINFPVFGKKRG